jgi:hypothetical protein
MEALPFGQRGVARAAEKRLVIAAAVTNGIQPWSCG